MIGTIILNDGNYTSVVGFGVFRISVDGLIYTAVKEALEVDYRHIDTVQAYFNEKEIGQAIKDSGISRDEVLVTSKFRIQDYTYETAKATIDVTLGKTGLDYLDLCLFHQSYGRVGEAWKALEEAKAVDKIKSIGMSGLMPNFRNQFALHFNTIPAVNQVEFNPYSQQRALRDSLAKDDVKIEAWAPLGQGNRDLLTEPIIIALANKYDKDAGQIILRFEVQEGIIVLPKSTKKARMASNREFFDFELTAEEMAEFHALDKGKNVHNPDVSGAGDWLLSNYDAHAND